MLTTIGACASQIVRDARWGRGAETPGECPTLSSWYAIQYVRGMQGYFQYNQSGPAGSQQDPPIIMPASSCLKHFFAYDGPEDWGRDGVNSSGAKTRFNFDARVTEQDLADTYLPAFEAGARPDLGGASGVMCSYLLCAIVRMPLDQILHSEMTDIYTFCFRLNY